MGNEDKARGYHKGSIDTVISVDDSTLLPLVLTS